MKADLTYLGIKFTAALLIGGMALAVLLSYLTPVLGSYGWLGFTIAAVHTGVLFVLLGIAVIILHWQSAGLQWSLSRNTTAAFAAGMVMLLLIGLNTSRSQFWINDQCQNKP